MLKALILILIIDILSIISSIICFCLPQTGSYGVIPVLIFLGLSVAEMIIFAYYTNRFHDKNREMSLLCAKTHFNKLDCIKISKDKGGNITLDIGDGANLYLKGYPFKKAFVAALIVRLIYYSEFTKQNKVEDFFKRH